jgi:hypothetical protein
MRGEESKRHMCSSSPTNDQPPTSTPILGHGGQGGLACPSA